MATTEQSSKPKSSRSKKSKSSQVGYGADVKLKTVVRRLPPTLPEDVFWQSVQPWVTDETVSWRVFCPGKLRKKYNKENIPSRAYIAFKTPEKLSAFSQAYDGHTFRDKAGNESYAVVEFAPCQKVPSEKKKVDPRNATIEQDEDFVSFIESLKVPTTKLSEQDALEALIASTQPLVEPKSTPLLDALRAEKLAQKDKETILKAHAHYRDAQVRGASSQLDAIQASKRDKEPDDVRRKGKQPDDAPGSSRGKKNRRGDKKEKEKEKDGQSSITSASTQPPSTPKVAHHGPSKTSQSPPTKPLNARQQHRDAPQVAEIASVATESTETGGKTSGPPEKNVQKEHDRRPRPGIGLGLASRHFEAALTGAGVVTPPGERKTRRERERERDKKSDVAGSSSGGPEKTAPAANVVEIGSITPAKERPRGGPPGSRRRGDGPRSPVLSHKSEIGHNAMLANISPLPPQASPLQPPKILPRPTGLDTLPARSAPTNDVQVGRHFDANSPGGRGGRGRGGRGGRRPGRGRGSGPSEVGSTRSVPSVG